MYNQGPAFIYEGLARAVFDNCTKYGDPFGIAAQDNYIRLFPNITEKGRRALSTIIIKMIIDHSDSEYKERLRKLDDNVWEAKTTEDITAIIDKCIKIGNSLGY